MPLRLPDKWVWDFWLAREGGRHHIFFLQAPRSLGDPELRHRNASIGHAVSTDLSTWTVLPDAIRPGPRGSWDDLATWTGSVLERDGRWHMLYTGISTAEDGRVQRIGLATSDDLGSWTKHPANPVIEADPRWYEQLDPTRWRDQSWRDPWLFVGDDGLVHALITARSPEGPVDGAGVVAHARSADFVRWEVLPPLTAPGEFAQVEVPQLLRFDDRCLVLVACLAEDHSRQRRERLGADGRTGTHVFRAATFAGPYTAERVAVEPATPQPELLYAAKLVEVEPGDWRLMAFRGNPVAGAGGEFAGEITDPLPLAEDALALLCGAADAVPTTS
jgi:beta-fructofuranosidase